MYKKNIKEEFNNCNNDIKKIWKIARNTMYDNSENPMDRIFHENHFYHSSKTTSKVINEYFQQKEVN